MASEQITINGKSYVKNDVLKPWLNRKEQGEKEAHAYLTQVKVNRMFAVGKQHLNVNTRDGRVVEVRRRNNVDLVQANILDQYLNTAIGTLASTDYKPNFLALPEDEMSEELVKEINQAFAWGWDNEWKAEAKIQSLWRHLAIDGTVAIRCRFDGRFGEIVGDVPYRDGSPILDRAEADKYVAEQHAQGRSANISTLREGKVVWELLKIENLLWPPGFEDPENFPWDIIRRPVSVAEVRNRYGDLAQDVVPEDIENSTGMTSHGDSSPVKMENYCMVYTGYERANQQYPKGRAVVFTQNALLDVREELDLSDHPQGPRTGLHYFRWSVIPGRFPGKAFIENGINPQKVYNKNLTQYFAIIDRNMPKVYIEEQSLARPKTGEPMEIIEVRPGAPLPKSDPGVQIGSWMMDSLKLSVDNVEKAMGIRGVSMGQAPQGVAAYSAMALLTENDAKKLDPVSSLFKTVMLDLSWDTMEAMKNWPKKKKILVAGGDNSLGSFLFDSNKIPAQYLVRYTRTGTVPNSQAAEIQKINDIWNASIAIQQPLPIDWYYNSVNAGKALPLPPSDSASDLHKAELENVIIESTGHAPPVAKYDNDEVHIKAHRANEAKAQILADQGDVHAQQVVAAYEAHIAEHEQNAQSKAPGGPNPAPSAPTQPSPTLPSPSPINPGMGQAAPPGGPVSMPPGV